ncbi:hypothetical protein HDK64DRAFT_337432 [Phyllosticta capitalensis]
MEQHEEALKQISERVKSFHDRQLPFRVYHGSTNSTRTVGYDPEKVVDTSALSHVISIDATACTAIVEPMSPWTNSSPQRSKRVFGAFSGTAAESSSFKYGYFDRTINWVEIVLATGRVVKASPTENADLFNGAAGACGTLGVTTLFEIKLIPAADYVQVTYMPVYSTKEALEEIDKRAKEDWDYIDGILYSATMGIIVLGKITDGKLLKDEHIQHFNRAKDPWFYMHAHEQVAHSHHTYCDTCQLAGSLSPFEVATEKEKLGKDEVYRTELIPIFDYFFRYDRGTFWMGSYGWGGSNLKFNKFTRWLFDSLFRTRNMYKAMHHSRRAQRFIIQDLALPRETAEEFIKWTNEALFLFPLWLCPVDANTKVPLHRSANRPPKQMVANGGSSIAEKPHGEAMTISIGLWGMNCTHKAIKVYFEEKMEWGPRLHELTMTDNRAIEAKVFELGGLKWLYAQNYYTEEEFWNIYDKQRYSQLRAKWDAGTLPTLWDKMKNTKGFQKDGNFPKAVLLTYLGKEHLMKRKAK